MIELDALKIRHQVSAKNFVNTHVDEASLLTANHGFGTSSLGLESPALSNETDQ